MQAIKTFVAVILLIGFQSCKSASTNEELTTENAVETIKSTPTLDKVKVELAINGENHSINDIDQKKSYLQFYTSDSEIKQDGNFRIASIEKDKSVTIVIDGLGMKGQDFISGKVKFEKNNSLALFKDGDTEIRFINGDLEIHEVDKKTGVVSVSASGKCTVKTGKSYRDMKIDIPATLTIEGKINDVKTLNFKK